MEELCICVGGVVLGDQRVLFIRQRYGEGMMGRWTIPWGYAGDGEGAGEFPDDAVVREIREEGGVDARVLGILAMQN